MKYILLRAAPKMILAIVLLGVITLLPVAAQEEERESPLLRLLDRIPRSQSAYVAYGDLEAWYRTWGIPRVTSQAEIEALSGADRAIWMVQGNQTLYPTALGAQYLLSQGDAQREFYGFNLLDVDRFIEAGNPPDQVTVLETDADMATIAAALTRAGYTAHPLASGGERYDLRDDYGNDLRATLGVARLAYLNRIALVDGQILIAAAGGLIDAALAASASGESLAEIPAYQALAAVIEDNPTLMAEGELVGALLMDSASIQTTIAPMGVGEYLARESTVLPPFEVAALATYHSPDQPPATATSTLALALAFGKGDPDAVAAVLASRLGSYMSAVTGEPLARRWEVISSFGERVEGVPVAVVILHVPDYPSGTEERPNPFTWWPLMMRRDLMFLSVK